MPGRKAKNAEANTGSLKVKWEPKAVPRLNILFFSSPCIVIGEKAETAVFCLPQNRAGQVD